MTVSHAARSWRRRRIRLGAVGALTLTLMLGGISNAAAFTPRPAPDAGQFSSLNRLSGTASRLVTVVVQLADDPVTVQSANANNELTPIQKQVIRQSLSARQVPVEARLRSLGGQVLGSYQTVYNGIKVRIAQGRLASIRALPGVIGVHALRLMTPDNIHGVPLVGAPSVWNGLNGLHGEGIKVAIIDTGIDYTHANFGGPGTVAAYDAAFASDTQPADPTMFGPNAPRVKGGIDLVGDDYNADPTSPAFQPIPHPDPNPLDCEGHGSHVAGTLGGDGVLANGKTYTGPYNAKTISSNSWTIAPGVAPKVDLYAVRVFGCTGSTDVVIDAIEWAVNNGMDVINMSLGSTYGTADSPDAVAASNAARAGVIVVASAGNEGTSPYVVGTPATGNGVISVAAVDPNQSYPGATIALSGGGSVTALDANGITFADGTSYKIKVIKDDPATPEDESLGCSVAAFGAVDSHTIAVVQRGTCARVAKSIYGQEAGAGAVLMINNDAGLPPYEGKITSNPDTGEPFTVTIPFLGVDGPVDDPTSDGATIAAADGQTATLTSTAITNPGYRAVVDFSSTGPRSGDSWLKPDIAAPGVSIISTAAGTGNQATIESGTSMASPFVAGIAALVRQAHPTWHDVSLWKAAIVNTADASMVQDYDVSRAGAGLAQAAPATRTSVVARGPGNVPEVNFGFAELAGNYEKSLPISVRNLGRTAVTFTVSTKDPSGSDHTVTVAKKLTVPANSTRTLTVTLRVRAASAGDSSTFNDVAGMVVLTPAKGQNGGAVLHVPYYLVPQTISNITTSSTYNPYTTTLNATITNTGAGPGTADTFIWGLSGNKQGIGGDDLRAAGVTSFPADNLLVFAISTWTRWSNAAANEYDVYVDVNGDGVDDYLVTVQDNGFLTTGTPDGQAVVAVINLATGSADIQFAADAPFNSSTMEIPVLFSQLCGTTTPCITPA
ncbi:MAG TPA: S8 family serine peptidase, partial [Candidatus Saccharimonadales bacterium]|nr:S8 family serine peptidase [Candidatus Saccharimonadales bacterium]